jgi:predicted AlkP superfamily pyrophosphatase or phosphodiesterase
VLRRTRRAFVLFILCFAATFSFAADKITDLKPTVILISIDGCRWDYPEKANATHLLQLGKEGVRAEWMIPSFPTKTFPNHYTIVTGLYPGHHGIVSNNFYDREWKESFFAMGDSKNKNEKAGIDQTKFWGGEPIWVTAEKAGQKTAPMDWPGSEYAIKGVRPSYWRPWVEENRNDEEGLKWFFDKLDKPVADRPTFFTLYWEYVDTEGHHKGPASPEALDALRKVDALIGRVEDGLRERGIFDQVNIMVVSDHGMTAIPDEKAIFLDDYVDLEKVTVVEWNPVTALYAKDPKDTNKIYAALKKKMKHAKVYRRGHLPARVHYTDPNRVMDIIISTEDGYNVWSHKRFNNRKTKDQGTHGFDNNNPNMRAIFFAHGPAFKKGRTVAPFANVELYNVMAKILGLQPAKNDGNPKTLKTLLAQ